MKASKASLKVPWQAMFIDKKIVKNFPTRKIPAIPNKRPPRLLQSH